MPESELEKDKKTEAAAIPAGKPGSSEAGKPNPEPDRKKSGGSAASSSSAPAKKPPIPRRAKWVIALLSLLCVILLGALLEVAFLPHFLEQDINKILQRMAGDGVEFRIKTISLTSAEVACKVRDTSRDGRPLNVGSIGSLSIRYSPLDLMRDRAIESIDIENCNITVDYSDGSFSIPAYDVFAKSFQTGEKREKDDSESAPADDLNIVVPVKIGRISLSGSLAAVARGEDAIDTLHIPYAVTVRPDAEQGWNRIESSLMVHFATNGIRGKATYLHKEKKVELDLDDLSLATSTLPGTVRSSLPRGLRAGISLNAKAEIDLNRLNLEELDKSSLDLSGNLTLGYRMPQGLRIDSAAPFSLKTVPRVIPTVKPMNPPKTEKLLVFTLGGIRGEYDAIPFELDEINASVSLPKRTVNGGFQVKVAESEPAEFSFGGSMDEEKKHFEIQLENRPLLKAKYKGIDVSAGFGPFQASLDVQRDRMNVLASFNIAPAVEFDGGALGPGLKGLTASFKPESIKTNFVMEKSLKAPGIWIEPVCEILGGELKADYNGMTVSLRPKTIDMGFLKAGEHQDATIRLTDGELDFEKDGMKVSFKPESFRAGATLTDGIDKASAELKGCKLLAELEGMTCEAEAVAFNAESEDGKTYKANAKIADFKFKQDAANLTYAAPEFALDAAYGGGMVSGTFSCPDSKLAMPQAKVLAKGLNWDFPFDYMLVEAEQDDLTGEKPGKEQPRTGRIALGELEYDGIRAASLDGTVQWDDPAKTFRMKTDANLFSISGEIRADVALGAAGVEVECGMTIPDQDADLSKDLARFLPQFEEISCTGRLGGSAVYRILPKAATGSAEFHIADADVLIPEKKLEARGVSLGFEVPDIAALKSAPGQTLSFRSVKYDKIETGAGRATFRMEAPDAWQIENALLDWCNGHIRLGGITYRIGQTTTEAVLYCDRLELPLFLTQIGLGQISGSGSINGTIPVVLKQKTDAFGKSKIDNIYFEDAFLFSTPGEDGLIKGEIDEALMDAESGIEMELAKDALKDFSYSWVRMRMLSSGEDKEKLKLELSLDGRPNRALYYAFDEKTASFIKSPTPCVFQGIRLDTNVNMYGKAMELVDYFQQIFSQGKISAQ